MCGGGVSIGQVPVCGMFSKECRNFFETDSQGVGNLRGNNKNNSYLFYGGLGSDYASDRWIIGLFAFDLDGRTNLGRSNIVGSYYKKERYLRRDTFSYF